MKNKPALHFIAFVLAASLSACHMDGGRHAFSHTPHLGAQDDDAKTYVSKFLKKVAQDKRFTVYYNLDDASFAKIAATEPSSFAVRIYNGYESLPAGGADLKKPCFIVFPLFPSGEHDEYSSPVPNPLKEAVGVSNSPENINIKDDGDGQKLPPKPLMPSIVLDSDRQWVRNYYAQMKTAASTADPFPSLTFRLSDYKAVKDMNGSINVRVYHALIGQNRIIALVGLDNDGMPIWANNRVVSDPTTLCPYECDLF